MHQYTVEDGLPSSQIYRVLEDRNGMIWFGTDKGLVRFDGYHFKTFNPSEVNGSSEIWNLVEDKEGRIWCSTFYNALYFWKGQFHMAKIESPHFPRKVSQYSINQRGNDYMWSQEPKLFFEIKNSQKDSLLLEKENFDGWLEKLKPRFVYFLKEEGQTKWFAFQLNSGVSIIKKQERKIEIFSKISTSNELSQVFYRPFILEDQTVLVFSRDKVFHFDYKGIHQIPIKDLFGEELEIFQNYQYGKTGLFFTNKGCKVMNWNKELLNGFDFLNSIEINTLYEDSRGNFWICTPSSGVYFLSQKARNSVTIPIPSKTPKDKATTFSIDKNGEIWFGLHTGNLLKMDKNQEFTEIPIRIPNNGRLERSRINNVVIDSQNNLHLTYYSGLLLYFLSERLNDNQFSLNSISKYEKNLPKPLSLYSDKTGKPGIWGIQTGSLKCYDLYADNKAWAGCAAGVFNCDYNTFPPSIVRLSTRRTYATATTDDTLWLGRNEGLFFVDISDLGNYQEHQSATFSGAILDLKASKNLKLWVAMEGNGLFRFDGINVDTIVELYKTETIISKLSSDEEGNLWISSNRGVYQIKTISDVPFEYQIRKYSLAEGLPSREIKQVLIKDSSIYVLTHKGLAILKKEQPEDLPKMANLVFTNLKINNTPTPFASQITLPHHQNNITFEYALLAYEDLQEIQYAYKMDGVNDHWQSTKANSSAYNTLTPGEYTFRVKAIDRAGRYSKEQIIELTISPPWWQTYWAYAFYLLFIVALSYFLIRQYIFRQLAQQEVIKMKELSEQKNQFFASITHEFRTPLTVIDGMAAKIKANSETENREAADVILKHETKLLHLVNQILDLAKLQEGELKSTVVQKDVIQFIRNTLQPFYEFAADQGIELIFDSDLEAFPMDFDSKVLQTILLNLLSNALKFTQENGQIKVNVRVTSDSNNSNQQNLLLTVSDNGQGITKKDLPYIFQRFYQGKVVNRSNLNPGTGIGLTFTKELIEKYKGKIEVKSAIGKGAQFLVYLPITNKAALAEEMTIDHSFNEKVSSVLKVYKNPINDSLDLSSQSLRSLDSLPQLLIIEDDLDMVAYLHQILNSQYQIHAAKTGEEGLQLALDIIPDVIIADILLPEKDGFELCRILKNDTRTSHIPIVMLTAKASLESKIEGLSRGADAYLTKPFVKEELFIRLKKLLELRLKMQKRYELSPSTNAESIQNESLFQKEDLFIHQIKSFIEQHIDNAKLDVSQICKHIGMSRTQLHKKMTAITGVSITKFIRKTRIEKAAHLLQSTDLPVAQIAHQTGLNPKHFSQNFKEVYDVTPRNYRKEKNA